MSALRTHLLQSNMRPSYVTITATPATFEEKYLIPEFDPILRSQPKHHTYCSKIAKKIEEKTRFVCLDTPEGVQTIAICPNGDIKHFTFKEDEVLTWSIIDSLRRKGYAVSRENFETIELELSAELADDEKANILKFLAAARALGKAKNFGVASIKRNPRIFARKVEMDCSSIFETAHGTIGRVSTKKKKKSANK